MLEERLLTLMSALSRGEGTPEGRLAATAECLSLITQLDYSGIRLATVIRHLSNAILEGMDADHCNQERTQP